MIRWYDYPIAFLTADLMTTAFFNAPAFLGPFIAWTFYEAWNRTYIPWREKQEDGK